MTSPLVSAARALAKSQSGCECFDDLEPEAQASLIEDARAVLGAIREPSDAMLDAASNADYGRHGEQDINMRAAWQFMVDKALSE